MILCLLVLLALLGASFVQTPPFARRPIWPWLVALWLVGSLDGRCS